jgi:murein DD-endopeptidase MepM/ murein hydrolase activator NlpD
MRRPARGGFPAFLLVMLAASGFGLALWSNAAPAPPLRPVVPTDAPPTENPESWQRILREGFGDNSTPLPTVAIPTEAFAPPTLAPRGDTGEIAIEPAALAATGLPSLTPFSSGATATPPPPTVAVVADAPVTVQSVTRPPSEWNPPPLLPPISRDPLGRDHYWLQRPVDSNANNEVLFYYPYGSDGQNDDYRVHHGIDMPNPVGETVRAAGSGEVLWAADGLRIEAPGAFQNSPSYGNVILIQHDFSYRGQYIWTLYAHLSAVLVRQGQRVNGGDVIGLVGETGRVTGPHVHFEVRMGRTINDNHYRSTYNPILWMVPYVGHGVIAGRVVDFDGDQVDDVDVTVRSWRTGLVQDTTTTYIFQNDGLDVNADPQWGENFAIADVPMGRYEVIATIDGQRVSRVIDVLEGTTSFVELSPVEAATPQPVTPES